MIGRGGPVMHRLIFPDARIPLADHSAPVLNVQFRGFAAGMEYSFLIRISGCCQDIDTVEFACGQSDGLAFGNHCIGFPGSGGSKLELHAVKIELRRKHLGRDSSTLAVDTAALGFGVVIAGDGQVEFQSGWFRLDRSQGYSWRSELERKGTRQRQEQQM